MIKESVGVNIDIHEIATELVDELMVSVKSKTRENEFTKLLNNEILFIGFQLTSQPINNVLGTNLVEFVFIPKLSSIVGENFRISSFSAVARTLDYKSKKYISNKQNKIEIACFIDVNIQRVNNLKKTDLLRFLEKNRNGLITNVTHELSHISWYKNVPGTSIYNRERYITANQLKFNSEPIRQLIYLMYFTDITENAVRSNEFWSELKTNGVKKTDFVKFLTNYSVYQIFLTGANLTYESLKESMSTPYELYRIKQSLFNLGISSEIINESSNEFLVNLYLKVAHQMMSKTVLQRIFNQIPRFSDVTFDTFLDSETINQEWKSIFLNAKKTVERGGNYESFFRSEIKQINRRSKEMIRRLSKLYSLLG